MPAPDDLATMCRCRPPAMPLPQDVIADECWICPDCSRRFLVAYEPYLTPECGPLPMTGRWGPPRLTA